MIITERYPVFKPNQVLSDGQMNKILSYLEPQDRETRRLGIGRGVLCGLDIDYGSDSIKILPGAGLTSAGYLFSTAEAFKFKYAAAFSPTNRYTPFLPPDGTEHIPMLKLAESSDLDDSTSISVRNVAGR